MNLAASADLGSNTFRLLIAEVNSPSSLRTLHVRQKVVRLAEGLDRTGVISEAALSRARECLRDFAAFLDLQGVENRVAALTASGRKASNGEEFRQEAEKTLKARVVIPSGREEALFSYGGALALCPNLGEDILFIDIGGGSTEIVRGRAGVEPLAESVPLGIVGFWEELGLPGTLGVAEREKLMEAANLAVSRFPEPGVYSIGGAGTMVSTAGTPMTLAALYADCEIAEARKQSGTRIPLSFVTETLLSLSKMTGPERRALKAIEPGREDLVLGGMALLVALMERYSADSFVVSDGGMAEGLLLYSFADESLASPLGCGKKP